MMFELSELAVFLAAAEEGSISGAAKRLNYVQSNVTARVRKLEERLGTRLFHRQSRGVTLTGAGRTLQGYATRILSLAEEAERAVQEKDAPSGALRIGAMETTAALRLPRILAAFHRAFPAVELRVSTGASEELLQRVLDRQVDLALVGCPVSHPELIAEPAFEEELVLAMSSEPDSGEEQGRTRAALVFRRGCSYRARLEGWLREQGLVPFQTMEFGTVEGIVGCVRAGMGLAALPRGAFRDVEGLELRALPESVGRVTTMLVQRGEAPMSKAQAAFRELLLRKE